MAAPHEILGVDPEADDETIVQAYRERVKEVHPDQGGTRSDFRRVKEAYETLLTGGPEPRIPETGDEGDADDRDEVDGPAPRQVEYLDYEAVADHGWDLEEAFERAPGADLDEATYGTFAMEGQETLLEAAERNGFVWPYSCRGGACANCAVAVLEGELSMPASHVLPDEMLEEGIRLSCVGAPITDDLRVVYNVKHLPDLEELRLPPGPFEWAGADD